MTPFGRFAIFIDGQSLYESARDLTLYIDYRRLLAHFAAQGDLLRTYYYTPSTKARRTGKLCTHFLGEGSSPGAFNAILLAWRAAPSALPPYSEGNPP